MMPPEREDAARRRRGLVLGGVGLVLLFAPAIALLFLPGGLAPIAVGAMVVGIVLLAAGFFAIPKRM